jgi:hypothetical protein
MAMGATSNRVMSALVSGSFLTLSSAVTAPGAFFVYACFSAATLVFVVYLVPETSGKTLEEMEAYFDKITGGPGVTASQHGLAPAGPAVVGAPASDEQDQI